MNDGTVMAAFPIRKPPERKMKERGWRMDKDGVCEESRGSYLRRIDFNDPGRIRFFDIMANRLNTRRSIREIVLPEIKALQNEIQELRREIRELTLSMSKQ
jgi:hypothetical protein